MKIQLHQYHQNLCDFEKIAKDFKKIIEGSDAEELHLYPELFLTGYPLQDICLQKPFFSTYLKMLERIDQWLKKQKDDKSLHLVGGLHYEISSSDTPRRIENVIFAARKSHGLEKVYTKRLLPNYDIFDERKYFTPGTENVIYQWNDHKLALLICEDMWPSLHYRFNPIDELVQKNEKVDLIVNLSASPFHINKQNRRLQQAQIISHALKAPFAYVNTVGEEDEILFDGQSFLVNGDQVLFQAAAFVTSNKKIDLTNSLKRYKSKTLEVQHTWEDLFRAHVSVHEKSISLLPLVNDDYEQLYKAITFGLQEYANKNGFKKFLIAFSGGIDSALVLALTKLSLKKSQNLEVLFMPSQFTSPESFDLAREMCEAIEVPFKTIPIKFLHSMVKNTFHMNFPEEFDGLADENVQSRLRATILMARSNQNNSLVINTSNKSEIAVGYSTLYGDSVGALSLIGDLYKTEVYGLAHYLNENVAKLIPAGILSRSPTAELKENQLDTDTLPPYPILDTILECLLSYRFTAADLVEKGISPAFIEQAMKLYNRSEYKRKQFCPILKVKTKSFGFGHRVPINKVIDFYTI
ncbi:MAG: NAD(+) synthase [Halobacteriovoraceae bacterium]|nr:NAD(+) synthase [Halobacteriovoraceae bacterium]MCB9095130.1 NAD(+) synthase [Halobacteriovoraceae bacterium]